ncbi:MAG TPA: hypothetical protein VNA13_02865 [Xanthomonadales bacterium]|nr:hypothetical protein [Xanthomonadales bacterium]
MSKIDKLEICKQTRNIAADSLYKVLKKLLASNESISEVMLRDEWLSEMRKNINIFPDGWYLPPPHGMIVLFADEDQVERFDYKNARWESSWARDDIFMNKQNGIIFCYASPVDKETGMIGDFALTMYFGNNPEIKDLLKFCLKIDTDTFNYAQIGMKIYDITSFTTQQMHKNGMTNDAIAINDKADINIGHSIPAAYEEWTAEEKKILSNGMNDWTTTKDMIAKKRYYINNVESLVIKPGTAFTIEPRPRLISKPHLPAAINYHTIAFFKENGEKELLTGFNELFKLLGMEYML